MQHANLQDHRTLGYREVNNQAVSENKFENNGHMHVFSPRTGADNPLWYF